MRVDAPTRSFHYFHAYAVKDRVDLSSFSDILTQPALPLSVDDLCCQIQILPLSEDYDTLSDNFATHISRCSVDKIPYFTSNFSKAKVKHIPHEHSAEMSQKSTIVSTVSHAVAYLYIYYNYKAFINTSQMCRC